MLPSPRDRVLVPELMDDPALPADELARALRGLARLNALSRAHAAFLGPVRRLAAERPGPLTLLDVAAGAGDVALDLASAARRQGVEIDTTLADVNPRSLALARVAAESRGLAVRTIELDAIHGPPLGEYDMVTCNLFLHHLPIDHAVTLLSRLRAAAGRMLVVVDLVRSPFALAAVWAASRTVTTSRVVRTDAMRSVRAAFTRAELGRLAAAAGLSGASIAPVFPARQRLVWRP